MEEVVRCRRSARVRAVRRCGADVRAVSIAFCVAALAFCDCGRTELSVPPRASTPPACLRLATALDDEAGEPASPIEYGTRELTAWWPAAASERMPVVGTASDPAAQSALAQARVTLPFDPESFAIFEEGGFTHVVGRDAVGAMYGALELAERVRLQGADALPIAAPIVRAPHVPIRGANLFVVINAPGETPASWWFLDRGFWRDYLGLLAHARMNVLDLHAMYNLADSDFANALLYFAHSRSFPNVGIGSDRIDQNVAMLETIVTMARARGIRVEWMTYASTPNPDATAWTPPDPAHAVPGQINSNADLAVYTREAAQDLATRVPDLWRIGFRIGESGHQGDWYRDTFVAGVRAASHPIGLYTRTWGATKPEILALLPAVGGDLLIESKYNGEQLGPPWVIAGGRFAGPWSRYSYQDYLSPPAPYTFVFQVRSGGTHRIIREVSFARTRRMVDTFLLGGARGFVLEATHAYFPQRDYYHHDPADRFAAWTFQRDALEYQLFGRLAYDPSTPESVFRAGMAACVGTDALWDATQAASEIVPWIQTAGTCGPDQKNFAPDLEWGGAVGEWIQDERTSLQSDDGCWDSHGPFDGFVLARPSDAADDLLAGVATSRISPLEVAQWVMDDVRRARAVAGADMHNVEARDVARECTALADLGEYFARKLRGATALAVYARTGSPAFLAQARGEVELADVARTTLGADTAYIQPFEDGQRMGPLGFSPFHWSFETARWLPRDRTSIDGIVSALQAHPPPATTVALPDPSAWLDAMPRAGPGPVTFDIAPRDPRAPSWNVTVRFASDLSTNATATLWWKPFSALEDWRPVPCATSARECRATVPSERGNGAMFAVEIVTGSQGAWRYPDPRIGVPYEVLSPAP